MKKYSLFIILFFSVVFMTESFGQSEREKKKMEKEAKKAERHDQDSISNEHLKALVAKRTFVLEANTLYTRQGESFVLNPTINFVGFDGKNSTIQLSFNQLVGWNGVGGVTLNGTISKMEFTDNKNGFGFTIDAVVKQKAGGAVTLIFRISASGNARVDMSGSYGERLSFQGNIVSLEETRVYKGSSIY